jgi:hypothetical protein
MTERAYVRVYQGKANQYANREDFPTIFRDDTNSLYQLSLLLTPDSVKAAQCFIGGFEDCVAGNSVFREGARSWAKRAIIQNAIPELKPRPGVSNSSPSPPVFSEIDQRSSGPASHVEIDRVFRPEYYERCVSVMSVSERCSEHDCTLLLECSASGVLGSRSSGNWYPCSEGTGGLTSHGSDPKPNCSEGEEVR